MKIMVVDDSKAMRMIVNRTLRQAGFGNCEIVEANNGKEALEAILASPPDLVLTDWAMPEMNGLELAKALRERNVAVKLGFVTSQGTAEMQEEAKNAGALFVLTKPFTADTFKATLDSVLK